MKDWSDWNTGWQAAMSQMWEAYCAGCTPIGAAVCDAAGNVVSVARNAINEENMGLTITHHQLAHAEANAILKLSEYENHPEIRTYTLYTTLEPCPFCFGAIVMGSIRRFAYAARDTIAGSACLNEASPYIRSKKIGVEGPVAGLESVVIAIKACYVLELPEGAGRNRQIANYENFFPREYIAGQKLYEKGILRALKEKRAGVEAAYRAAVEEFE